MSETTPSLRAQRFYIRQITALVPEGFPGTDHYWRPTVEPHDRFVDAIRAFEQDDNPLTRSLVRETGQAWVDSWHKAVFLYEQEREQGFHKVGAV